MPAASRWSDRSPNVRVCLSEFLPKLEFLSVTTLEGCWMNIWCIKPQCVSPVLHLVSCRTTRECKRNLHLFTLSTRGTDKRLFLNVLCLGNPHTCVLSSIRKKEMKRIHLKIQYKPNAVVCIFSVLRAVEWESFCDVEMMLCWIRTVYSYWIPRS